MTSDSFTQRYDEETLLGEGGIGQVVKATDLSLHRPVAMKTLHQRLADDPTWVQRFEAEAKLAGRLEHANIPPIHELGQKADGSPYYTMRLVEGESLLEVIQRLRQSNPTTHQNFPFTRRLQIIQEVCHALDYAHNQGYLHCDIKPENVMIGRFGEVQVVDWGLSKVMQEGIVQPSDEFAGTPQYAPPECLSGDPLDPRTDLYCVGVLLYELCTLSQPFQGNNLGHTLHNVLTKKPPIPESIVQPVQGRVPRETSKLILKAMAFQACDRFGSAVELKQALQQIIQGDTPIVCPHTAFKRSMTVLGRFLDNHNSPLVVGLVYLWVLLPILWALYSLWTYFRS